MAVTTTTSTTLTEIVAKTVEKALEVRVFRDIMVNLVHRDDFDEGSISKSIPFENELESADVNEGTDATSSTFSALDTGLTAAVSLTPGRVVSMANLTDLVEMNGGVPSNPNKASDIGGRAIGTALGKKLDTDLLAYFSGFSQTAGSAGASITSDNLFQAFQLLLQASAPTPYYFVGHTKQVVGAKGLSSAFTSNFEAPSDTPGGEVTRNGLTAMIGGFMIFADGNVTIDANDDAQGGAFSEEAIVYAEKRDLTVEVDRDPSAGTFELVGDIYKQDSELRDDHGVYVLTDVA
jgi:hypothetical protein